MMRRLVLVSSLLAAVCGLNAQEDETVTAPAISLVSRSVFRGVEQSGAGAQGTFQVSRNAWRVGMAVVQPFDHHDPREVDFNAAYVWKATERINLEAVLKQRWFTEVPPGATKDSFEAGLSAAWSPASGWVVELAGFHDCRLKADTVQVTANYSMPLKNLGVYLERSASLGTSSARDLRPDAPGGPIRDSYSYYTASVRLPYRIGAHTKLVAGLYIAETDGQSLFWSPIAAPGGFQAWAELGLSLDF